MVEYFIGGFLLVWFLVSVSGWSGGSRVYFVRDLDSQKFGVKKRWSRIRWYDYPVANSRKRAGQIIRKYPDRNLKTFEIEKRKNDAVSRNALFPKHEGGVQ